MDFIIRQQQLVVQEIDEGDVVVGNFIIAQRLQDIKAECELNVTVLGDLTVALFLLPQFDVGDLPMRLFIPSIINGHQLRESRQPNFLHIQQEEKTLHEDVIIFLPKVLNKNVKLEKTSIKEETYEKIEKLIITGEKEFVAFKDEEILDFIACSKIDFVIKPYEEIEVYIVEFETDDDGKSYYLEKDKIKIWRKVTIWNKIKLSKLSRTSKAIFKVS